MTRNRAARLTLAGVILTALSACGDSGVSEVRQWMEVTKSQSKVTVPKLSEPKKFLPFTYAARDQVDPFNPGKLAVALAKLQAKSSSAFRPDLDRRREALEGFPLDVVRMVGTLQKPGLSYAILQIDKAVYHAKVGNYVGQNFGIITNITDSQVELKEVVQDASGEWVERKAQIELQENKK